LASGLCIQKFRSRRLSFVTPLFRENPDLALRVLMTGMPDGAYRNLQRLGRIFPAYYRLRHKIKAQRLQQDRADVADALDRISRELQPSGYLVGEAFSGPHGRSDARGAAAVNHPGG